MYYTRVLVAFLFAFAPFANAFFRVTCAPYKRERIDALISPGKESSHMHTFWGGRNIGPDPITSGELRQGCTSCDNQHDKSAYWIPTLYYVKNGVPVPVKVSIFHVYYQGQNEGLEPFPEDYAVVAGSPDRTEEELRQRGGAGIDWHYVTSDEKKEAWEFPKKRGDGWLRANVPFPSWVVKDASLGRYRECVDRKEEGCRKVMSMFFAIWYDARDPEFFTFENGDHLALSSGGGHTYHGDFIYGWDQSVATEIVRNTTEFARIGGDAAYKSSEVCNATAAATPYLWDLDVQAKKEVAAGNATFVSGSYGIGLTITDGKSINSTWTGDASADQEIPNPSSSRAVQPASTASTSLIPALSYSPSINSATAQPTHVQESAASSSVLSRHPGAVSSQTSVVALYQSKTVVNVVRPTASATARRPSRWCNVARPRK
ncbi:hypothetical protein IQ07DRAFT_591792 [Pyrenochaeta sp. DS3sAY3a]|nr:hypothetical protein IQ07DRAFT_591792 [Pyrenochaeta sp. DS3sAY3a]